MSKQVDPVTVETSSQHKEFHYSKVNKLVLVQCC